MSSCYAEVQTAEYDLAVITLCEAKCYNRRWIMIFFIFCI